MCFCYKRYYWGVDKISIRFYRYFHVIPDFYSYNVYVTVFLIFRKYTMKYLGIKEHNAHNLLFYIVYKKIMCARVYLEKDKYSKC